MITIPQPCSEDWGKMHAVDSQHRNCDSCQTTVTDFSQMSDDELVLYLKHGGKPKCGRFLPTQLNRKFTPLPEREVHAKWWRAMLLIPLSLFGKQVAAQQQDSLSLQNDTTLTDAIVGDSISTPADSLIADIPGDSLTDAVVIDTLGEPEPRMPQPAEVTTYTVTVVSYSGCMAYIEDQPPLNAFVLQLLTPFRKKDSSIASIQTTNPNSISTHDPNEKPEPPAAPLIPETPWYQAILPSITRIKRNG